MTPVDKLVDGFKSCDINVERKYVGNYEYIVVEELVFIFNKETGNYIDKAILKDKVINIIKLNI